MKAGGNRREKRAGSGANGTEISPARFLKAWAVEVAWGAHFVAWLGEEVIVFGASFFGSRFDSVGVPFGAGDRLPPVPLFVCPSVRLKMAGRSRGCPALGGSSGSPSVNWGHPR